MSRRLLTPKAEAASGAIALVYTFYDTGDLERVIVTLDAGATTPEALTITRTNATAGSEYDAIIFSVDPSVSGGLTFRWENFGRFVTGDVITIAYANTDAAVWSAQMYVDIQASE